MSKINIMKIECYSKKTIKSYSKYINEFVIFSHGDLNQKYILSYLTYLAENKMQPSTINVARSALVYLFNKVLNKPITIHIPKQRIKHKEPNPLSRENIKKMTQSEDSIEKRLCIELACGSGLRRSEIINLKWEDIDFTQDRLRVVEGKGNKDRTVPLSKDARTHLLDLKYNKINSYVFPNRKQPAQDWHISENTPLNWVKEAANKAGIEENVFTHRLRASFITHGIENGNPEKYIQKLAGHNSRQTTDRYEAVADYRLMMVRSPLDDLDKGIEMEKELKERSALNTKKVFNN